MKALDQKINEYFAGKVVRKDLTQKVKGNAIVPNYVLEYLLGQYCASDDEETIAAGIETVKSIIAQHFVHRDEAEVIKSKIREKGTHRIIDKLSVRLNDKEDRYEARFSNLGLSGIPIATDFIKRNPKLLSEGVWSLINMAYMAVEERNTPPWIIESVKPIQIAHVDLDEYKTLRSHFTTEEWIDLLMQSIGLAPEAFSTRSKLIQLARLIPFAENNYNLMELGPKGTGKSHVFSELSPHGILISGGEVSKAKLFVNNANGNIGLVGYWDVVAYDEFAGKTKKVDRGLVDILKNYMANKSFSRGADVYQAEASMVFVGNTDHSVPYMLRHSHLFDPLPKDYHDTAFLDRIHAYLPGWEVSKLRNELFTGDFGFIVDYLAEVLKALRKEDYSKLYQHYFTLSPTITTRDKTGIEKTFSGLVKIVFPGQKLSADEVKLLLDFAIEARKRVKDQILKMDETFQEDPVCFNYLDHQERLFEVESLEDLEYGKAGSTQSVPGKEIDAFGPELKPAESVLRGGSRQVRENQTNVSYETLFGDYLVGATEVVLQDPYIRLPHQMRNFMEFCTLLYRKNPDAEKIKLQLLTWNEPEYQQTSHDIFQEITASLSELNIELTVDMKLSAHDRFVVCNNGWKIVLGRGLDIWQKGGGRYDVSDLIPEKRKCKEFEVIILPNSKEQ